MEFILKRKSSFSVFTLLIFAQFFSTLYAVELGRVRYKTSFGHCPAKSAGPFTLKMAKIFEKNLSLRDLKKAIIADKLDEQYFLSEYQIKYNPIGKIVQVELDCPAPLMKVQIYKNNGIESYDALLTDKGTLVDPTYEALLRNESMLTRPLPSLAIPVGEMDKKAQRNITDLVKGMEWNFRQNISEIILNESSELTMILSFNARPVNVFLGKDNWPYKSLKLKKIMEYMTKNNKSPSTINMTNSKKIVVKF